MERGCIKMVKLRNGVIFLLILLVLSISLSEKGFAATKSSSYKVNATALNVRKGPSTHSPSIGMVKKDQTITVYQIKSGWAYMSYGKLKGYVSSQYIKTIKLASTIAKPKTLDQRTVTANSLNIRKGPSAKYAVVGSLKKGNRVTVSKVSGGWAYITYGKTKGYVSTSYLRTIQSTSSTTKPSSISKTPSKPSTVTKKVDQRTVTVDVLNVRKGPSAKYAVVGSLKKGNRVTVSKVSGGWAYITYGKTKGYVSTSYLKAIQSSSPTTKPSSVSKTPSKPSTTTKKVDQRSVTADVLNVRKGPSANYAVVGSLKKGNKVTVSKVTNGWAYITYGKTKGYVSISYLKAIQSTSPTTKPSNVSKTPSKPSTTTTNKVDQRVVTVDTLNVRKGPGTNYSVIGKLKRNNKVTVTKVSNGWAYIAYGNLKGYVSSAFLLVPKTSSQKVIVIDAGHGGSDPGASGNGIVEKELNLSVALRVQKLLEKAGIKVVMTRSGDTYPTLDERNSISAQSGADAFVSIHTNTASASSASGTETYYNSDGDQNRANKSKQLAGFIQNRLYKAIGTRNRGVLENDFRVIKYNPLPAVLVELGYLSNPSDAKKLKSNSYRDLAARSIYEGILDFYKTMK